MACVPSNPHGNIFLLTTCKVCNPQEIFKSSFLICWIHYTFWICLRISQSCSHCTYFLMLLSISSVETLINGCFFWLHFLCFLKYIINDFSRTPLKLLGGNYFLLESNLCPFGELLIRQWTFYNSPNETRKNYQLQLVILHSFILDCVVCEELIWIYTFPKFLFWTM